MANSILSSHASGTSNTILVSHGWPDGSSPNSVLGSHDADYPAAGDTTPDAFTFTDQTDVAVNTTRTSNAITVAGITAAANISITGGTYQIGAGSFVSTSGTVTNGQTVTVRHTSSASNSTATNTVLTIGGVSDTFTSTTVAASGTTLTDGSNFTITGTGFGTRANAPEYTNVFDAATTDAACTTVGINAFDGDGLLAYVSTARTHTGSGKSLRIVYPEVSSPEYPDSFPKLGIDGLSLTKVYISTWFYWERLSGTGGSGTFKLCRGGGDPPYTGTPRFYETYNGINSTTGVATSDDPDRGCVDTNGTPDSGNSANNAVNGSPSRDGWHRLEYYFDIGTEGNSDGTYKTWVDGVLNGNMVNRPIVRSGDSAARINNVITPFDGMDGYSTDTSFACYIDDFHVDSTLLHLELGNASTWGACTIKEYQPSTAWSDTSITATCRKGAVESGTRWLYVIAADGTASAGIEVTVV